MSASLEELTEASDTLCLKTFKFTMWVALGFAVAAAYITLNTDDVRQDQPAVPSEQHLPSGHGDHH
jgi:hypothetical protein